MEPVNPQTCLNCNHTLHGRTDKKFCNDNCRNTFHNKTKRTENNLIRNIKAILHGNRRILSEILGDKSTCTVHRAELVSKGFHFEFITQIHTHKQGSVIHFCYEYGYKPINESSIHIFKQKNDNKLRNQ